MQPLPQTIRINGTNPTTSSHAYKSMNQSFRTVVRTLALSGCLVLFQAQTSADDAPTEVAGRTLEEWTAQMSSENAVVRRRAALTLPSFGDAARPALTDGLGHDDPAVVYWCASGLGDLGDVPEDAVATLTSLLEHERIGVRMSSAYALCRAGYVEAGLPVLMDVLENGPDVGHGNGLRTAAADFIGRVGPPAEPALPLLERMLDEEDYHVRDSSKEAIRRIQGESPVSAPGTE